MDIRKLIIPTLFTALTASLLVGLGVWQVQRLQWKRDLIVQIDARAKAEPISIPTALDQQARGVDIEHFRVRLEGRFLHDRERHLYSLAGGRAGWRVLTPVKTQNGSIVIVDRGFVPHRLKDAAARVSGQLQGSQRLVGRVRLAIAQGAFAPDNEPRKNEWFWRDIGAMAADLNLEKNALVPWVIDLEATPIPGNWPRAGVIEVKPSNRHLGYAITWFSLAAILLIIYALFIRKQLFRP